MADASGSAPADALGSAPDRFLVVTAWGTLNARPAASCFVADKNGFTRADLEATFPVKTIERRAGRVLFTAFDDAVVEGPAGKQFWLVLAQPLIRDDPSAQDQFSVVTLMASEFLDSLLQEAR